MELILVGSNSGEINKDIFKTNYDKIEDFVLELMKEKKMVGDDSVLNCIQSSTMFQIGGHLRSVNAEKNGQMCIERHLKGVFEYYYNNFLARIIDDDHLINDMSRKEKMQVCYSELKEHIDRICCDYDHRLEYIIKSELVQYNISGHVDNEVVSLMYILKNYIAKYLFCMEEKYLSNLHSKEITSDVKAKFRSNKHCLSQKAKINSAKRSKYWEIEDSRTKKVYAIVYEKGNSVLNVFEIWIKYHQLKSVLENVRKLIREYGNRIYI